MSAEASNELILFGRSSSHFTRVARIFAEELGVRYALRVVPDLLDLEPASYGGNPALRVPALKSAEESWFGAQNICRELARRSPRARSIVWPEAFDAPVAANAQELILQAMSTEVALVMNEVGGGRTDDAHQNKLWTGLRSMMLWLDQHAAAALSALPAPRDLSYLEVTLFCLVTHLEFRELLPVTPYVALDGFRRRFAERESAQRTAYRFDG